MKFGNDSSIHLDNCGTNNGIQIGNNTGSIVFNQGLSAEDREALLKQFKEQYHAESRENTQRGSTSNHTWYRSDTGEEIHPDQLLKIGNTTAQLDGNIARAEILLPNGKTIYTEYDMETNGVNIFKSEGFPEEYEVKVPPELILHKFQGYINVQNKIYPAEKYFLKFGGYLFAVYDTVTHKLLDFEAKSPAGMVAHINVNLRLITFINKKDVQT